jgi:hypothetical protein
MKLTDAEPCKDHQITTLQVMDARNKNKVCTARKRGWHPVMAKSTLTVIVSLYNWNICGVRMSKCFRNYLHAKI